MALEASLAALGQVPIQVPLVWVGLDDAEISFVNQLLVQQGEGTEFFLSFGQVAPPVLLGDTPEANLEAARSIPYVPVRTLVRMETTAERMEQFIELMQRVLGRYREFQALQMKAPEEKRSPRGTRGKGGRR